MSDNLTDLTIGEIRSVLASITQVPQEDVEDYLIIIKTSCRSCKEQFCNSGGMAMVNSRASADLANDAFTLHLCASVIESLAQEMGGIA